LNREEAIALLRGGPDGVKEWNRRTLPTVQSWQGLLGAVQKKPYPLFHEGLAAFRAFLNAGLHLALFAETEEREKSAMPDLSGANLEGADLTQANLIGANLAKANLSKANLTEAFLVIADLRESRLEKATLCDALLQGANLKGARCCEADFSRCSMECASLSQADLRHARLQECGLDEADLTGADLTSAILFHARLCGADLTDAKLIKARLEDAFLYCATLCRADLSNAELVKADFCEADLTNAVLTKAMLHEAYFGEADLSGADLSGACLEQASFVKTNLCGANLDESQVYGISVWDANLKNTSQKNLLLQGEDGFSVTVSNLAVAQFIYFLWRNRDLRQVIDEVTAKVVLILGRFTPKRKRVLDSIREALNQENFCPVLFDFPEPANRDGTETISLLAQLSRFIVVDLTDPKSVPHELATIVPHLRSVPVLPIIENPQVEYGMFRDFGTYPWVLPVHHYNNTDDLLACLRNELIPLAKDKARQMRQTHSIK